MFVCLDPHPLPLAPPPPSPPLLPPAHPPTSTIYFKTV